MPDNSRNSVMFAVRTLHTIQPTDPAANCHFCLSYRRSFSLFIRPGQPAVECEVRTLRKLRFLYCIIPNTFIQCEPRMNRALAEPCTVPPKASCRALYANNSRPTSWPAILRPVESASRATIAAVTRRAPSSPLGGHSSSGPSHSKSSASICRTPTTPVSDSVESIIPGPKTAGDSNPCTL